MQNLPRSQGIFLMIISRRFYKRNLRHFLAWEMVKEFHARDDYEFLHGKERH